MEDADSDSPSDMRCMIVSEWTSGAQFATEIEMEPASLLNLIFFYFVHVEFGGSSNRIRIGWANRFLAFDQTFFSKLLNDIENCIFNDVFVLDT